ncbi:hypothetical protein PG984_012316 [Apiospora sp. TS-2023a]
MPAKEPCVWESAKHLAPSQVNASDGPDDVVANLPEKFYVNGLQDSRAISAMDLERGQVACGQISSLCEANTLRLPNLVKMLVRDPKSSYIKTMVTSSPTPGNLSPGAESFGKANFVLTACVSPGAK